MTKQGCRSAPYYTQFLITLIVRYEYSLFETYEFDLGKMERFMVALETTSTVPLNFWIWFRKNGKVYGSTWNYKYSNFKTYEFDLGKMEKFMVALETMSTVSLKLMNLI